MSAPSSASPATDPEAAFLAASHELFRKAGYYNASIEDLVRRTGRNRSSIYVRYGNKLGLFTAALEYESALFEAELDASLKAHGEDLMAGLRAFFDRAVDIVASDHGTGSLHCAAAMELAAHEAEIAGYLERKWHEKRALLAAILREAQAKGAFRRDISAQSAASALITLVNGVGVQARSGFSKPTLIASVEAVLSAFETFGTG